MTYDSSRDRPHPPGAPELWQESDCYWFYDEKAKVGGYHRIGQFPNRGTGQAMLFVYRAGGQRFRMLKSYEASDCSRTADGQRVGSFEAHTSGGGVMRYRWAEMESDGDLEFYESFYAPRSWMKDEAGHKGASAVANQMNTDGHLEVSGRIRGQIRIGADRVEIDALAHRDRSWGMRDNRMAYQHRMVTGTLGPQLSWATFIMHLDNGVVAKAGFVARDGETTDIADIQVLTEFDHDGLTVAGLRSRFHLADGTQVDLAGRSAQGFMALTDGWLVSSHHFIPLALPQGEGFTILDVTNRPSKGDYAPKPSELTAICAVEGLSSSADYSLFE